MNADPDVVVTEERCSDCQWPEVCGRDRTCWDENKRLRLARQKKDRAIKDVRRVIDLDEVRAGKEAERLLAQLGEGLAAGIEIEVPAEPHDAAKRLLATLGVTWRVGPGRSAVSPPANARPQVEPETTGEEQREMTETAKCKRPGCERDALNTRGRFAYLCDVHKQGTLARGGTARPEAAATPEPEPEPAPDPQPAASANGAGPTTYAERARIVLDAAERFDKAWAELDEAREGYETAKAALEV